MLTQYRTKVMLIIFVFLFFSLIADIYDFSSSGKATIADVTTEASIQIYFAIEASQNFTNEGISFNISSLPAIHANSTGSYGEGAYENMTLQNISVSSDTNTNIDLCVKASANLTSGGNVITLDNYKWSNSIFNNLSEPNINNMKMFNATFYPSGEDIAPSGAVHFRFWLNASGSQASGIYNNTINFKAVSANAPC